ncbi:MAG TPA: FUSC family protein, partial [Stellaceae bacterium]|nr:FUSC family protein [Stellaceae bacterium]
MTAGIAANFARTLAAAGPELPDTRPIRRDFLRRVIALDPLIDETLGESPRIRYHSPVLQRAVDGLFAALAGWRAVVNHLARLSCERRRAEAAVILRALPAELLSLLEQSDPTRETADPIGLHRIYEAAVRRLIAFPAGTPALRMLADKTAEVLAGMSHALNGLALLVADPARPVSRYRGHFRLRVPDWLPAAVNAGRAFITIGAVALFWIVSAWPSGAVAITWAAISVILFAPQADQAYATAMSFTVGTGIAAVAAAIVAFAVLPGSETFAAFCVAIGVWLVPTAAAAAQPWRKDAFTYMSVYLV